MDNFFTSKLVASRQKRRSRLCLAFEWGVRHTIVYLATLHLLAAASIAQPSQGRGSIAALFSPSYHGIIVVAHRGCHQPAPMHHFGFEPENSLAALEHCVSMGVDMMELDVQMSADGNLVIMHDDSVDRTTNGRGKVRDLTLAQLESLRLRQNLGGYAEPLTDQGIPTLAAVLTAAKGRITLNLDVKDAIYAEVVDAVLRAGVADGVNVKTRAGIASPPLARIEPFKLLPFIPVLDGRGSTLLAVAAQQLQARPVALELPRMNASDLPELAALARQSGVKLFSNTLGDGFTNGIGGDLDAAKDPASVWGWEYAHGISAMQTDYPEALLAYRHASHSGP